MLSRCQQRLLQPEVDVREDVARGPAPAAARGEQVLVAQAAQGRLQDVQRGEDGAGGAVVVDVHADHGGAGTAAARP